MTLAIFDLDHTLLNADSDYLWGEFLVEQKLVNPDYYKQKNDQFYQDYVDGVLDIDAFLKFSLQPLTQYPTEQLYQWREQFVQQKIKPVIAPKTPELVSKHKQQGHQLIIISATNFFVTEPIAKLLDIPHLLSTKPEILKGKYTGNYVGKPTFQSGKIDALQEWMIQHNENLEGSYFYTDSHNDLPLLEQVTNPIVVNPDERLKAIAQERHWQEINLN